eukprot:6020854-Prorocentrum_lima.AAC.1
MWKTLTRTKETVVNMCQRAYDILERRSIEKSFEMQIAVYRNYNVPPDRIFEASGWSSTHDELSAFLQGVTNDGGWGNEAIEIGLQHVNEECRNTLVQQIVLIGDGGPNLPTE